MPDLIDRLSAEVASRMRDLGLSKPGHRLISALLEVAYLGTLRAEEGRFVRGSLTFADPESPDVRPPRLRRADYPSFTKFGSPQVLSVQTLVKLSRAIDQWSGSIAVFSTGRNRLSAWGVVDQMVQQNMYRNHESSGGFANPGLLTVNMDGIGDISAYHGSMFLGAIKSQAIITRESDALNSRMVYGFAIEALFPYANAINGSIGGRNREGNILSILLHKWAASIARLCIGLRQRGTGGAFLLSPTPIEHSLTIGQHFKYSRLKEASILSVMDHAYYFDKREEIDEINRLGEKVPSELVTDSFLADADMADRDQQLTGAVKLVSSLATVDGLVLMTPALSVVGFGVKITPTNNLGEIYDGYGFSKSGTRARKIDPASFGTRHGSMLSYCRQDAEALGIVVSQDGYARLIMTHKNALVLWDNLKLLNHWDFSLNAARQAKESRKSKANRQDFRFGYTEAPKTIDELMNYAGNLAGDNSEI